MQHIQQAADRLLAEINAWSPLKPDGIGKDITAVEKYLQTQLLKSPDFISRIIQTARGERVLIAYIDGLVDTTMVDQDIIAPLLKTKVPASSWNQQSLHTGHVSQESQWDKIWPKLLSGNTILVPEGSAYAWIIDTVKYMQRSIGRPETEASIRGPQEAFNEVVLTQMNQIRRRLRDSRLSFQAVQLGHLDHHQVIVAALRGVVNPGLLETVLYRLRRIRIDAVPNATQIGSLIRDHPYSIFPTLRYSEHVDFVVWALEQGKVAVLVDGDPFVMILPATMWDFYKTPMDYNSSWYDASFVRFIRMAGFFVTLYFPSLYIVFTTTNQNLVPYQLLTTIMGSHIGLPFPPILEAVVMIFVIEIIREAALRLPKALSTVLGTMGAIVVGTAIVKAGFVSNQIIVIMTITALSFYSVPSYELVGTWRLVNFLLLAASQLWGLFGVLWVSLALIVELDSMVSFGVPYLSPGIPINWRDLKDSIVRLPLALWKRRLTAVRPLRFVWRYPLQGKSMQPRLKRHQVKAR
ncbi:MAG: spore germination protein [Sulfobacillus thermosulfidooxidans]|uniref:Spore germination protein n=1 Tax=Sulfobacillus thermosulfidooxidans TaxID=28034 RepID=A0A2T2WF60_SULTH|nr:MAG: spore germination protein [Sulfobacillus thermosulfidooxidans]